MVCSKRISRTASAIALALSLAACTSYKAASPNNFTRAINAYYAENEDCLYPTALRFPYEVSAHDGSARMAAPLDALTAAGLLQRKEDKIIQFKRYSLTTYAASHMNGRFCYGHRQVTSIDSFTPPGKVNGHPISDVTYSYKMMDVPGWAQSDRMRAAFPALARETAGPAHDTARLVLTPNGWRLPE